MPRTITAPPALARNASLACALLLAAGSAPAQEPAAGVDEGAVQYRQKLMSGVGADMGAIGDIMKYGLPLTAHVAAHARSLSAHADLVAAAFERKVVDGPTDAKPEIWARPDEFAEKTRAMKAEADRLATIAADPAATPAAIGQQVKALGKSCGECHDSFRKPKEESYKRAGGGA
jgi:cytochrome c556